MDNLKECQSEMINRPPYEGLSTNDIPYIQYYCNKKEKGNKYFFCLAIKKDDIPMYKEKILDGINHVCSDCKYYLSEII